MKRFVLGIFFLLATGLFCHAQDLKGVWRGSFQQGYGAFKQKYKYEVQINQLPASAVQKGIQGVTYSYRTTVFYGKASLVGIYDSKNKSITIKETKLVELRISDNSEPCLMTCYLEYRKEGKVEILEGTYTSVNVKSKNDCGSGYVYLEKVEESDFEKEDFLVNKKPEVKKNSTAKTTTPPAQQKNTPVQKPPVTQQNKTTAPPPVAKNNTQQKPPVTQQKKTTVPPPAQNKTTAKTDVNKTQQKPLAGTKDSIVKSAPVQKQDEVKIPESKIAKVPVPDVFKTRENKLFKSITTAAQDIQIQLFDNGDIDGDTITVYDNNEVIALRKGLTAKPITINVKADMNSPIHDFVMVANNLGSIPPNTALMVITTGGKRYELFISSDEKNNARVVIEYKIPGKDTK